MKSDSLGGFDNPEMNFNKEKKENNKKNIIIIILLIIIGILILGYIITIIIYESKIKELKENDENNE